MPIKTLCQLFNSSVDGHPNCRGLEQNKTDEPLHTISVLNDLGVPHQPKISNLKCLGQGESIDTHSFQKCLEQIIQKDLCTPLAFLVFLGSRVSSKCRILNAGIKGSPHPYCSGLKQKTDEPPHTLNVLEVLSQPKMSNLKCLGQGESLNTC